MKNRNESINWDGICWHWKKKDYDASGTHNTRRFRIFWIKWKIELNWYKTLFNSYLFSYKIFVWLIATWIRDIKFNACSVEMNHFEKTIRAPPKHTMLISIKFNYVWSGISEIYTTKSICSTSHLMKAKSNK